MTAEPVATLHVLGRARVQQLTEAEYGDEHPSLVDLAGLQVKPLDRIAGVIDFDAFSRAELPSGDARLAVLRELAVKLLYMDASRNARLFRRNDLQIQVAALYPACCCRPKSAGPDGFRWPAPHFQIGLNAHAVFQAWRVTV
jgi:hypothetical protein